MINLIQLIKIIEVCVKVLKEIWDGPLGEIIRDFLEKQQENL